MFLWQQPSRYRFALLAISFASMLIVQQQSALAAVAPEAKLEQLWNEGVFTEGVAAGPDGMIYFSDITRDASPGRVMKFEPKTGKTTVHSANSGKSNGLMFNREGKLIASCGSNHGKQALCEILPDGKSNVIVDKFMGKKFNSPNDLVIHPNGSIYFSDPRYVGPEPRELDHMSVFRRAPDGAIQRVTTDIEKPNGVILSPDGKTLYVAETNNGTTNIQPGQKTTPGRMTLNSFPINDDGSLGPKRVLIDFGNETGVDGMTVDTAGSIYAAVRSELKYGIIVYNKDGVGTDYIRTAELPTNCCFGIGPEAKTLYITAGKGLYRIKMTTTGFHPAIAPLPKK